MFTRPHVAMDCVYKMRPEPCCFDFHADMSTEQARNSGETLNLGLHLAFIGIKCKVNVDVGPGCKVYLEVAVRKVGGYAL